LLGGSTGRLCKKVSPQTALKGISDGAESYVNRQNIPDCGCKVAEGSFAKFSRKLWTIKKKFGLVDRRVRLGVYYWIKMQR